jgi:phage terminase large subunit-like protein
MTRIVVAIDPAVTSGEEADETGIIVAGKDANGHGYVLADLSGRYAPIEWARIAVSAYRTHRADRIVAEVNNGGDLVEATLRMVDPNVAFTAVRASRGKVTRAEPASALCEQGRIHHVGTFPHLEDQMTNFTSDYDRQAAGYSPDRVDGLVWALTDLLVEPMRGYGIFELTRRQAEAMASERQPDPAPVSVDLPAECVSIDEVRRKFAAMLNGRQPTANETSAHEAELAAIVLAGGGKSDALLRLEAAQLAPTMLASTQEASLKLFEMYYKQAEANKSTP